jgi:hypothetical protein
MIHRSIVLGLGLLALAATTAIPQPYPDRNDVPFYGPAYGYYGLFGSYLYSNPYGYLNGPGDYAPHDYPGPNPRGGNSR